MSASRRQLVLPAATVGAISVVLLAGCAREPSVAIAAPSLSPQAARSSPAETAIDRPTGTLALRDALAAALLRNPRLRATAWEPRLAEARRLQAGLRPNPELEASTEGSAATAR